MLLLFRAVLFDYSGTLFDPLSVPTPANLSAALAARGIEMSPEDAGALWREIDAHVNSEEVRPDLEGADTSREKHRTLWTRAIAQSPGCDDDIAAAVYSCITNTDLWRPYPDTSSVLTTLKRRGIPVGVISNVGWDITQSFSAELKQTVDSFTLSCDEGVEKPDAELFQLACARLDVRPEHALMVGNDARTDGGAVHLGMPAYILPPARGPGYPRGLAAVLRLTSE